MDRVVMRSRCLRGGRIKTATKLRHAIENGPIGHFDSMVPASGFDGYYSRSAKVLPVPFSHVFDQISPLVSAPSAHHGIHGGIRERPGPRSLVTTQQQRTPLVATHVVVEHMQLLSNVHHIALRSDAIQITPATDSIRHGALQKHGHGCHRRPRPVQDVKKAGQKHNTLRRQIGCSQQGDCVSQCTRICSVFQCDDSVSVFVPVLQSIAQLGQRRRSRSGHSLRSVTTSSKRTIIHTSFIRTAAATILHAVLPRARWTCRTNRSTHIWKQFDNLRLKRHRNRKHRTRAANGFKKQSEKGCKAN